MQTETSAALSVLGGEAQGRADNWCILVRAFLCSGRRACMHHHNALVWVSQLWCRGVQNMLVGSGTSKVQRVLRVCKKLLSLFDASYLTRSTVQPAMLVMGPWTGPRSTKQFTAAATVLDAALRDRLLQEERIHYMSMLFKPQRFGKPSREELKIQSKSDLVRMRCLH